MFEPNQIPFDGDTDPDSEAEPAFNDYTWVVTIENMLNQYI
jgi:hypothetical protein